MEYEALEQLWKKYDSKLDRLEKMNKRLVKESLLRKPTKKLNWYKFRSLYGFIMLPIIFIVALHPNFTKSNVDTLFIVGCIIALLVIIYEGFINLKSYLISRNIDLSKDTVMESASKIVAIKKLFSIRYKYTFIVYPMMCLGILLIVKNQFTWNRGDIIFIIVFFIITYAANIFGPKAFRNRIAKLEREILDLKEYVD